MPVLTGVTYSYDSNDRLINTSSNDPNDLSTTYEQQGQALPLA